MENLSKNERLKQAKEEIKAKLVRTLHELTEQYCTKEKQLYPDSAHLIHQSLVEVMGEYEYQVGKSLFTPRQSDHICYQIGEWYCIWKNNLINWEDRTHRLGYAKELLKIMICDQGGEDA